VVLDVFQEVVLRAKSAIDSTIAFSKK